MSTSGGEEFGEAIDASAGAPPYHFIEILRLVEAAAERCEDGQPRILDHGCGGGLTGLYLTHLSYRHVYGVDVKSGSDRWNGFLKQRFGYESDRYFVYEGRALPFDDAFFDLIFSQQVLEHVDPLSIEDYYVEEAQVLKVSGQVYHEVPHRLVPYESHTQTWFIHYFPEVLSNFLYRAFNRNLNFIENELFLRWPGFHISRLKKYFGAYENRTERRLKGLVDLSYYDGSIKMRQLLIRLTNFPVLGDVLAKLLSRLIMMSTLSQKMK